MAVDTSWIEEADLPSIERANGLPAGLLDAIAYIESRYNPNARSPVGAAGAFQFMPATAKAYGLTDPNDPIASAKAAGALLGNLVKRYNGDVDKAIAAYNWGPAGVDKHGLDRLPKETRNYLAAVKKRLASTEA